MMAGKRHRLSNANLGIPWSNFFSYPYGYFGGIHSLKIKGNSEILHVLHIRKILGGGFNPSEKNLSNWIISPNRDEHKKIFQTTT